MLSVDALQKRLGDFAMRDVSFDVAEGDYFVLLGASGVGKTVLLETLAGLVVPDGGRIVLDGADITATRIQKRRMALVYQDQALFPHMSVKRNIAYGLPGSSWSRRRAHETVEALAATVGASGLLHRHPGTLSGGEAQRVALARALATQPRCLLLDEPLAFLDARARGRMRGLLRALNRQGHTMVHVTHDYEEALSLASHVGIMENGRVVQTGTPTEVFHHPKSEFVAQFVGIRNFFHGTLEPTPEDGIHRFITHGLALHIATNAQPGPGSLILRSEDITLSQTRTDMSAQNSFLGTVVDIAPSARGVEVIIDIGVEVAALVTERAVEHFHLHCGQKIWAGFKATAARFIEE
ncbi:MAG: ATP-binding cassette domain-containing protein [Nitrospiraceae bacterium]|nr:ATP-binding cassette domain-containing protein [Nitrospiraceae bacterium]